MHANTIKPTRRDILAGTAAIAFATAPIGPARSANPSQSLGASGTTAQGTVYEMDSSPRKGVPNVMVSNGLDVVKTGDDGGWSLPVRDGDSLFVIKPAGWALPVDAATNLPHFAYVHAPSGSPDLGFRFAGVAPTGALPASIDFGLRRQPEQPRFDAVLFTDPQPESLAEVDYIRDDVVAVVEAQRAAFGITHGDVMFDDLSYYPRYNRIVGTIGLPWFNCRGNHDMNMEAPDNNHSAETFKRVFGARWHAFQHGNATLTCSTMWTTWAPTQPDRTALANTAAFSASASWASSATCWPTCRGTAWWSSVFISRSGRMPAPTPPTTPSMPGTSWPRSARIRIRSASAVIPIPMSTGISPRTTAIRPTAIPAARITTTFWPPSREAGGPARSTPGASQWHCSRTAHRTAFIFCR
jgi:hypothetical protein